MNENADHTTETSECDFGSQFAIARRLFVQLRDADQAHLRELTNALTKLVESHYSLLQSGPGRSDITSFLVAATMRSADIRISGAMPVSVGHYVTLLQKYLLTKCRLEGVRATNGYITLKASSRVRNPSISSRERPTLSKDELNAAYLIVMAEVGIIYVDTSFAHIRDGVTANQQGLHLPVEVLTNHAESHAEWRIAMPLPAIGSKEEVASRFVHDLLTGGSYPHLLAQFHSA